MLNPKIDPQNITREAFEKHVDALQEAISKHFHINTQKRGKLRDVAAMTMFGCVNGYQQLLPKLQAMPVPVPMPESYIDLPDEIHLLNDSFDSLLAVFGPGEWFRRQYELGDFIRAVIDEFGEWSSEDEHNAVMKSDENGYTKVDYSGSQVMRQIHHDYIIQEVEVSMPRIDKYGVSPLSRPEVMREALDRILVDTSHLNDDDLEEIMMMTDTGDDSSGNIRIKLVKKES